MLRRAVSKLVPRGHLLRIALKWNPWIFSSALCCYSVKNTAFTVDKHKGLHEMSLCWNTGRYVVQTRFNCGCQNYITLYFYYLNYSDIYHIFNNSDYSKANDIVKTNLIWRVNTCDTVKSWKKCKFKSGSHSYFSSLATEESCNCCSFSACSCWMKDWKLFNNLCSLLSDFALQISQGTLSRTQIWSEHCCIEFEFFCLQEVQHKVVNFFCRQRQSVGRMILSYQCPDPFIYIYCPSHWFLF